MEKDIMIIIERIGKVNDRVMEEAELVWFPNQTLYPDAPPAGLVLATVDGVVSHSIAQYLKIF
jgi:hypothetical protein